MITILLFVFYSILGVFVLYKSKNKYSQLMSWQWMSAAFLLRVIIGCVYGYLYSHALSNKPDTWRFFQQAMDQAHIFRSHPLSFFTYDILDHPTYSGNLATDLFKQDLSFFSDMHGILFVRVVNLLNFFSGDRYYVNVVIFNIGMIWGSINMANWLYKCFAKGKFIYLFFLFLFPSFLYWNCGVHRDGFSFWILSSVVLMLQKSIDSKNLKNNFIRILCILIGAILLFIFKIYWILIFVPYFALYLVLQKRKVRKPFWYFTITTFIAIIIFGLSQYAPKSFQLTEKLAEKQHGFLDIPGTILLKISSLNSSIASYFQALPDAFRNIFLTPAFKDWFSVVGIFALFGQFFFWGFLILCIFFPLKNWKTIINQPFILFLLFFSISNYAIIGITIPYLSALIRYLINFQTFILIILGCVIDWNKIFALRIFKKFNMNIFAKK